MPNPVVHFEILGKEPEKLQNFYRDLFDWKIDADNPMNYGVVDTGDGGMMGGIGGTNLLAGHLTFYVQVDDLDAYLQKAVSVGGRVMAQPSETGAVRYAVFADPEGNIVGLAESKGAS